MKIKLEVNNEIKNYILDENKKAIKDQKEQLL